MKYTHTKKKLFNIQKLNKSNMNDAITLSIFQAESVFYCILLAYLITEVCRTYTPTTTKNYIWLRQTKLNKKEIAVISLVGRVFTNGPGNQYSISHQVIPKIQKMVLDAALLCAQHYKIWIKGKVEQFRENSSAFPNTSGRLLVTLN